MLALWAFFRWATSSFVGNVTVIPLTASASYSASLTGSASYSASISASSSTAITLLASED